VLDPRIKKGGGDYESIVGYISTDWSQYDDGSFSLEVPPNATAHIHLPAGSGARIQESGRDLGERTDLRFINRSGHEAIFETWSGTYRFTVRS